MAGQNNNSQETIGAFAIKVEKMLCDAIGRRWSVCGMSIETLVAELAAKASTAAPAVPAVDALTRYDICFDSEDDFIAATPSGNYVKLADVQALLATPSTAPDEQKQADSSLVMPRFAAPASQYGAWVSATDQQPDVAPNDSREFIIACQRGHNGKTYVFAADYLNAKLLQTDDDDCPEDGKPFAGWYQERDDSEYDTAWHPVCQAGDVVTHFMPLPPTPDQFAASGSREGRDAKPDSCKSLANPADAGAVAVERAKTINSEAFRKLVFAYSEQLFGGSEREQVDAFMALVAHVDSSIAGQPQATPLEATKEHPDDVAVDKFAVAMKAKMAKSRAKGRGGWDDPAQCRVESLAAMLVEHVGKGDPVDIGNFAMMIHLRGGTGIDLREALAVYMNNNQPYALTPEQLDAEMEAHRSEQMGGAQVASRWKPLMDSHWVNIVNHDRAYENYTKDDAVHEAVKRTEAKLRELNASLATPTTERAAAPTDLSGNALDLVQRMRAQARRLSLNDVSGRILLDAAMMVEHLAKSRAAEGKATSERKPLTVAEIDAITKSCGLSTHPAYTPFTKAIEQHHGIGGGK